MTTEAKQETFTAAGATISLHDDMLNDLPPMWQVRFEEWTHDFMTEAIGQYEAAIRLFAIFTHATTATGTPVKTRLLESAYSAEDLRAMMEGGARIFPFLTRGFVGDSGNAESAGRNPTRGKSSARGKRESSPS